MVKDETEEYTEEYSEDEDYQVDPDEALEVLDFDFERLITEGKDAIIEREIEFFDIETQKKMKMKVFVKPITRAERSIIERKISDKKRKIAAVLTELLCEYGWVRNKEGIRFGIEDIRKAPDGVANSVANEINFISGQFTDRWQDAAIDKVFGSS